MKIKFKLLLRWIVWFIICFVVIYLSVFLGAWKLFTSGNPILIEIGVALILSIFVFAGNEATTNLEKRVKLLEEKIKELEEKQ